MNQLNIFAHCHIKSFLAFATLTICLTHVCLAEEKFVCDKKDIKVPDITRTAVYANTPFKSGESSTFEVSYMGLKAGYATIKVMPPRKYEGVWHRIFSGEAKTGDWFKAIYIATYEIEAISRPWDFGIAKFYMEKDEGKLFSNRQLFKKWLDFYHDKCKVNEKTWEPQKPDVRKEFDLQFGAIDALGVVFKMRTRNYQLNKIERELVYTSEKNWWLEANPIAFEKVTVPSGTFDTVKLKLQTFIGKELQQKGDVYAWIATSPEKPLVQVEGEIKIGSLWMKLHKFTPGS